MDNILLAIRILIASCDNYSEDIAAEPIEDAEVIDENENSISENNDALDRIFGDLESLS